MKITQTKVYKILAMLLIFAMLASTLTACGEEESGDAVKISFKSAATFDYLKSIDGKLVTINGYMATSSPVDGSFMFLMNLPYQSCPFCVPNTTELSNTLEVYPKDGERFDYTTQAIKIVGKLVVASSEDDFFEDEYGYKFNCKIVDATYTILKADEISADLALWQKVAESDIVTELYAMYDYVNFLCAWNTYFVNPYTASDGSLVKGYYLAPDDALYYITTPGAQWNYGYTDGYFDGIIADIKAIDESAFGDLIANVEKARVLAEFALGELNGGNYTGKEQYVEKFDRVDVVYTLNRSDELNSRMNELYNEFSAWIGNWEL